MSQNTQRSQAVAGGIGSWLCVGLFLAGCAGVSPSELEPESLRGRPHSEFEITTPNDDATVALLPVGDLREDLLMRQRVTVKWSDREEAFDAVLQKHGTTLLLMGLGPMNTVGFRLTLDEGEVSFMNRSGREMPFQPERILSDVQRVFYPWLDETTNCVNCERSEILDGLEVRERIGPRFLEERSFRLLDEPERGRIIIRYEGWTGDPSFPVRATLDSGWFGYELIIETNRVERID